MKPKGQTLKRGGALTTSRSAKKKTKQTTERGLGKGSGKDKGNEAEGEEKEKKEEGEKEEEEDGHDEEKKKGDGGDEKKKSSTANEGGRNGVSNSETIGNGGGWEKHSPNNAEKSDENAEEAGINLSVSDRERVRRAPRHFSLRH